MGLFVQLLSLLARRPLKICKKSFGNEQGTKKDALKKQIFSNYFILAAFSSTCKFSKIGFTV